ncbi:MAG: hypothetical protein ABIR79_21765 [Candidatus Binatia bacterium]
MTTTTGLGLFVLASSTLAIAAPFTPTSAFAATVEITDDDARSVVTVGDVTRRGNSVAGTLTNRGAGEIHDLRLLIEIPFLWANEVKPGEESPGRSTVLTVKGPLAPHGTLAFEFAPNPPLPERTDGRFGDPQVRVMGFNAIGMP